MRPGPRGRFEKTPALAHLFKNLLRQGISKMEGKKVEARGPLPVREIAALANLHFSETWLYGPLKISDGMR